MKRRIFSIVLAMAMIISMAVPALASYDPTRSSGGYNYSGYYDDSNYSGYYGEDYYNYNYRNTYYGNYYMSSWAENLKVAYDPTWYEQPQRQVARGEAFLLFLRAVQRSLQRQGYSRLTSGYGQPPFYDYNSVNPYAQSEVNVLWSNGILVGYDDGTMRFSQLLNRAEMAAIYSRFNRIYFNMGVGYSQYGYDGYNNYYNNNYNSYYNNYMFNDVYGHWAQQDIITAASNGVLVGVGNGDFDTEGKLTIEQIWKILDCCVGYQGLKRSDIAYAMSQTFKVKFGKNIDEDYGTPNGIKVTRLSASPSTVSINEGETRNIKVSVYPSNAEYQKLNWSSSNTNYVSIEESWNSSAGTAYVTIYGRRYSSNYITLTGRAMDGSGKSVTVKVKVNRYNDDNDYDDGYITSITPSESTIYLQRGESRQINARIRPSGAYNKNLKWTSNDSNIAYPSNVYTSGNYSYATITGNNIGTTYIYIKAMDGSGEQESVKVIVQDGSQGETNITSAVANPSSVSLKVGNSQNVSITIYPANAVNKNINWTSDNENVARVEKISNNSIRIIAVGVGNTNIRGIAESTGNVVCTIPVTVTDQGTIPSGDTTPPVVTLEGATNVKIGETITIIARASDETSLQSFNIGVNSIIGMTGSLSPTKIEKLSATEYRITLMGVEVASQCICIAGGAAIDSAGNVSEESNEIVIFINSGEE